MKLFKGKSIVASAILVTVLSSVCMAMEADDEFKNEVDSLFLGVGRSIGSYGERIQTLRGQVSELEEQVLALTTLSGTNGETITALTEDLAAVRGEKSALQARLNYIMKQALLTVNGLEENARGDVVDPLVGNEDDIGDGGE
ncbi:hypothetical protein KAT92_00820 [Candidatus Babeliales bacterium]|nr:hypothetical protein [Candidatus Babeliales bacterium]